MILIAACNRMFRMAGILCFFSLSSWVSAEITVVDSLNRLVTLKQPARRIVALAPHIVENIFAAGAGNYIVGAVDYCDYPEQAKAIPRVGAISTFSAEAIVALKPDLVVLWHSDHGADILHKLDSLGIKTYASDPRRLSDVSQSIRNYGILTAKSHLAEQAAALFDKRLSDLTARYAKKQQVSVLYQVWSDPLQTLNGKHIISDVIQLCAGSNVFADAIPLAPKISVEAVIERDPDVIIASGMGEQRPDWLDAWRRYDLLKSVKKDNLFFIPPDIIQRHTPRLLDGAQLMCRQLEQARKKSAKQQP